MKSLLSKISSRTIVLLFIATLIVIFSCKKDAEMVTTKNTTVTQSFTTTPYSIVVPKGFPQPIIPANNQMTVEGVTLGKYLFYDSILSGNYKQSCSSCHLQKYAFSNGPVQFSTGADGISLGNRNAPALFNKAFDANGSPPIGGFFWDGRATSLEDQALMPLANHKEMNIDINEAVRRLQASPMYPGLFAKAFGSTTVVKENIAKAIAQFVRSIVSGNSEYDSVEYLHTLPDFRTTDQKKGYHLFFNDPKPFNGNGSRVMNSTEGVDCGHCHAPPFFTPEALLKPFLNDGLTMTNDAGALVTDIKVPSLRNLDYTGPFMHDGSMPNLDTVIAHYDHSPAVKNSPYLSAKMFYVFYTNHVTMNLNSTEIRQLKAFLGTLNDNSILTNPEYKNPFIK